MQGLHGHGCDLEHHSSGMDYDLGGYVHELSAKCGWEGGDRDDRRSHVLLEGLEEEETEQHGVVEGRVGCEAQEGQFFEAEVFEGPMHQFVCAALVVGMDNSVGRSHELEPCLAQLFVNRLPQTEVGVDKGPRPTAREEKTASLSGVAARRWPAGTVSKYCAGPGTRRIPRRLRRSCRSDAGIWLLVRMRRGP